MCKDNAAYLTTMDCALRPSENEADTDGATL